MAIVTPVLLLLGFVGHIALFVLPINLLYGTRYRNWWVTLIRWVCKAAIVAGPVLFLVLWGARILDPGHLLEMPALITAYLALTAQFGIAVVVQTIRRWRRLAPRHEISHQSQVLDIAHELGHKPYGHGPGWLLARAPWNQIFQVEFVEKTFRLPLLPPAWRGLSILHLTDLHLCGIPDRVFYERVLAKCVQSPPDLLVITGDVLDSDRHYDWITPLLAGLRWRLGAFAILGNHDSWLDVPRIEAAIQDAGIQMLGGRWQQLDVLGSPLIVMGNETPWLGPAPDLSACPSTGFRLCLSHSPDTLPWARTQHVDLLLAGHNHGGQIRLPVIGPVLVPSKYSRRYDCGTFYEAPTLMYVSRGLGGTYPLRWNCRPEVTRLILT